jgi:hypothetical protein
MRVALLAFALLPSVVFGEHGLSHVKQPRLMTFYCSHHHH